MDLLVAVKPMGRESINFSKPQDTFISWLKLGIYVITTKLLLPMSEPVLVYLSWLFHENWTTLYRHSIMDRNTILMLIEYLFTGITQGDMFSWCSAWNGQLPTHPINLILASASWKLLWWLSCRCHDHALHVGNGPNLSSHGIHFLPWNFLWN